MGIKIQGDLPREFKEILTDDALDFLAKLHRTFDESRRNLLAVREKRETPHFLPETESIRKNPDWVVAETPPDLMKRRVEITGPVERKMMINALNSGADVFMADFEDSNSPTWQNVIQGQINLRDAVRKTISFTSPEGKKYSLNEKVATLLVRPRGWHINEKHIRVDGEEMAGALVDFGLYFFHNAQELLDRGTGPYFYLPKLQSHEEARLWNFVFVFAQEELGIDHGTIRATVLIETIFAAFEMEEILYELRHHASGLNAGRWDYIFSAIKTFRKKPFPDRIQITMKVPFMRAYANLLVKTCHKRAAHAMGGMSAFIPNRKDPEVTEAALLQVRDDKAREAGDGFDGTWVAHPDLVPIAMESFVRPSQKGVMREEVEVKAEDLLNFAIEGGRITETGLRLNINVAIQYIASWLRGVGAVALYNLMEDAATAEISRVQVWQWIHSGVFSKELVETTILEELKVIRSLYGERFDEELFAKATEIFRKVALGEQLPEFFTLIAYEELP